MVPAEPPVDFNAIINVDRQRRKNQALTQSILGSGGRRQSAPGSLHNRKHGHLPSLASRVGVIKRVIPTIQRAGAGRSSLNPSRVAAGNVNSEWTHDLHESNISSDTHTSTASRRTTRPTRTERLYASLNSSASSPALNTQFNVINTVKPSQNLTIKGLAGPYIVLAKNFAEGTTADDIESAMTPVGGVCLSCRIISDRPVIAELIFDSKEGADIVVATFNNQNADGNLLQVSHKVGLQSRVSTPTKPIPTGPRAKQGPANSTQSAPRPVHGRSDLYTPQSYSRRGGNSRKDLVDGSFGFEDRMDTDDNQNEQSRRLYSDDIIGRRDRGGGRGSGRGRGHR